jgi:hypothetical protein
MKRFSLLAAILILMMTAITALPAPATANARHSGERALCLHCLLRRRSVQPEPTFRRSEAIGSVQNAIQTWGKLTLVYEPSQADIVILVTSRPSEDVMAVYDGHQGPNGNYLWRVMGRDGLVSGEAPLVTEFEKGFESVQKHK